MYRNQLRSDRLNDHATTARRPGRGSGSSTHWVVSGGRGSTAPAARTRSPPYRSGRPGSVQQQYRPRSPTGTPIQGNATSYSPAGIAAAAGHTPVKADACASSGSLDIVKPSNGTAQSDILSSVSTEGTWAIDFPAPTVPTKGYSSPAVALQFGTFSLGVTSEQCTTSSSSTSSALPDLKGEKHEKALHGLCDEPDTVSSSPTQNLQKQEATDDLVLGGGTELINKYENSELHETPMLNSIPPTGKVCVDSCTMLKGTSSSPTQLRCQNQEETNDINANRTKTPYKYPATKPKISVQIPASYTTNLVPPQFMLPGHGRSKHVAFQQKQPQVPIEFRDPGFQMQPIGSVSSSLPVKMTMPMGNVPHIQPVFVHGAQPHAFRQQPFIHQGQGFGCANPANCHLPQFGNMRIAQELSQQHPRSNGEHKRTIKITHPETHEELMLDRHSHSFVGVPASRHTPLNNINRLHQPVQRFSPLQKVYYPRLSTYSSAPIYVPNSSTVSLASREISSKTQPTMQGFNSTNSNHLRPPMPTSWIGASSRALTNLHTASEGLSAPGHVEIKSHITVHAKKNEVSLKHYGDSTISNQKNDCKIGLEISPKPKFFVSEGNLEVLATTSDIDSISQGVPTQQTQTQQASVYYVAPTIGPQTILTSNLPLASTTRCTCSIKAKSIGVEESSVIPTTSSSHTKLETIDNKDSGRTNGIILTSTSFTSNIDGTSSCNRNSKYDGCSILGKPPLIHTQEMVPPKFEGSNTSTEYLRKDKENLVPFLDEKTELNSLVPLQNQDFMIKEHVANEKEMCSESKTQQVDDTITNITFRLENETSFTKLGRFDACHKLVDLHPSISIDNIQTSNDNQQSSSHAQILLSQSENKQNDSGVDNARDVENSTFVSNSANSPRNIGHEMIDPEASNPCSIVPTSVVETKKIVMESTKAKSTNGERKKRKEMLPKARGQKYYDVDSASSSPSENINSFFTSEDVQSSLTIDLKQNYILDVEKYSSTGGNDNSNRIDWEDRTKNSKEKLKVFGCMHSNSVADVNNVKCESDRKRYSQDFLLTFAQSCIELPEGFKIGFDISGTIMGVQVSASFIGNTELNPTHARIKDRGSTTSRANRHMASKFDDDKWRKQFSSPVFGRNLLSDNVHQTALSSWDAVQHGGHGPTGSLSQSHPFSQYSGEMISRAMKEVVYQRSMSHGSVDERWQNRTNAQGISSPYQVNIPIIHKAEKKYEIGKVSDEEEAKQRQLKAILNKLTPQNFEKLFTQVKELNIDNVVTLTGVISQIFDKALMEPTFCEMYASFCFQLASDLPDFVENNEKITFKRLLLNKCQEEFERGEREQAETDKTEEEGGTKKFEGGREEKRIRARRRMLGNIRLIGELYKKKMLTERIMHECINKLLGEYQNPDEEDLEALCKLMSTIGEMIDHPRAKAHMDFYLDLIKKLSKNLRLSSRIRFLLEDVIDLRKNKWRQRRKVEGPKKIEEVRMDAVKQKFGKSTRFGQSSATCSSGLRLGPLDNRLRGSSSLASRGSSQVRRYGSQNVNLDVGYQPSNRALLVPLHQRRDDKSIRLDPQGDLGRGMSLCEKPLVSNDILPEVPLNNHHGEATENSRQDSFLGLACNPTSFKASDTSWGIADLSSPVQATIDQMPSTARNETCVEAQTFPEGVLQEKTILTIKEFYSAKDEKEVAVCMKELNAPSFYPLVVSLWIIDSFERKDIERELLAKLLVYLCKTQEHLLSQRQLLKGFQHVLSTLEDAMTDAPKATMFLGQIFARVILEDVISLTQIGELLQGQDGREKAARHAVDDSLTSEVMGSMLESIRVERGDSVVDEIRAKSNLQCSRWPRVCV